ncbi:MAG: hypothetical protein WCZ47_01810 [Bacilli bacterium]
MDEVAEKKLLSKENKIEKMKLLITITNYGYGKKVLRFIKKYEVALNFSVYGRGTGTQEIYRLLGLSDRRKEIIFSIVKNTHLPLLKEDINNFYLQKKEAKGIAFSVDISSVIGTSIYKYLTNTRTLGEKQ